MKDRDRELVYGDELFYSNLVEMKPQTAVVIRADHRDGMAAIAQFASVREGMALFWFGKVRTWLVLTANERGELLDNKQRRVRVCRYLGK